MYIDIGIFIVKVFNNRITITMNILFTTINKKACTTEFQKKLWNGAEQYMKDQVRRKLQSLTSYIGNVNVSILIDMNKGFATVLKNNLSEEQFFIAQRTLRNKI